MSQYYLMAQLPSLDGLDASAPLPITPEDFRELCTRFLDRRGLERLEKLSLTPAREEETTGSELLDAWNRNERQLRLALASLRAARMRKSFDIGAETIPAPVMQAAREAAEQEDPLTAEENLNRYRMDFLAQHSPMDGFCEDAVFHYGLKLYLMTRMRRFEEEKGRTAYRTIYDSILQGAGQEKDL